MKNSPFTYPNQTSNTPVKMIFFLLKNGALSSRLYFLGYTEKDYGYTIVKFVNEMDLVFKRRFENYAVEYQGLIFLPNETLDVASRFVNGCRKFFLTLNGLEIFEVNPNETKSPYILNVIDRGTFNIYLMIKV